MIGRQTGYTHFTLDGAKALEGLLKEFPERVQRDIVNSATRAGASVLRKEIRKNIKANGSFVTGRLYNSISVKKKKGTNGVFYVYASTEKGKKGYHAHLVEFGTGPRRLKKPRFVRLGDNIVKIEHTGSMPAKPFFRPAIDSHQQEVLKAIVVRAAKRMAKESEKMSQKWGTLSKSYKKKLQK